GTLGHTDGAAGPGTGGEGSPFRGIGLSGWWGDPSGRIGFGVGIGRIGTIGHGSHRAGDPYCRCGDATSVSGRLPAETLQRRLPAETLQRRARQSLGRFRACYQPALATNPNLAGRVTTRFVIGRDGSVQSTMDGGSDLPDPNVSACVVRAFSGISFPQPEGGI